MIGGRTARWKFVAAPLVPDVLAALYNLQNDPQEQRNVVADYPEIAEEIKRRIETTLDSSIEELEWPEPTLETADIVIFEDRLYELGCT